MEIEVKIPLDDNQFKKFKKLQAAENSVYKQKCDTYYSKYSSVVEREFHNEPLVRIREETVGNSTCKFLTLKRKFIKDGIENNDEKETKIEDPNVLINLLSFENYRPYFVKNKETYLWHWQESWDEDCLKLNCELVVVNNKFHYFEVEAADYDGDRLVAVNIIKKCLKFYNLDIEKADGRSWKEIMEAKQ